MLALGSHASPDAVQNSAPLPVQHGWPWPPQAVPPLEQAPPLQVPSDGLPPQVEPLFTQALPTQQLPVPQTWLAQQAWPAPPQEAKVPWPLHTIVPAELFWPAGMQRLVVPSTHAPPWQGVPPAQGGWLGPPQAAQVAPSQARVPELQVLPAQQGWPMPPHWPQVPLLQVWPAALHVVPPQQGWLEPPQPAHWLVARQRSPARQVEPATTQALVPPTSQQPPVQLLPAQQG